MQVQFNRPVTIGKETYGKGQHSVPNKEVKNNWFFDALVKEGNAVVLRKDDSEEDASDSIHEVNAISAKSAAKKAK